MHLYLVRHAAAFDADPAAWPDDRDRPLTRPGTKKFKSAAQGLRELVPEVAAVLCSGFVRARQTAQILEDEAGWPAATECPALEAGRSADDVLAALQPHREAAAIALVGHEPNLRELASLLLTGGASNVSLELKKGGVVCLELEQSAAPGAARLLWLATPKMLRALA